MNIKKFLLGYLLLSLTIACSAGEDSSSDNGNNNIGDSNSSTDSSTDKLEFETQCGAVHNALFENPVSVSNQVTVVRVISSNLLAVRLVGGTGGDFLVKLHGLAVSNSERAVEVLEGLSSGIVYYVPADETCILTVPGGGSAYTGQLFTAGGKSFSEELILSGYAGDVEASGTCHEALLAPCYTPLAAAHTIKSAGQITDFLWKPRSDSSYNSGSPVIHVNPCDATVYVNGQALPDYGPGNGRCNTSRMFNSCSSYGSNIKVEVIDNDSGLPYFNGNDPYVIVPSGCSRFEFKR